MAIPSGVGKTSASKLGVNRHTMRVRGLAMMLRIGAWYLAEGYENEDQCRPLGPCGSGNERLYKPPLPIRIGVEMGLCFRVCRSAVRELSVR